MCPGSRHGGRILTHCARSEKSCPAGVPRRRSPRGISGSEQWSAEVDPRELEPVAETLVHPPHRDVGDVVLRPDPLQARLARSPDLRQLQRMRDAATACPARDAGHEVLRASGFVLTERCPTDHLTVIEGDEAELA